MKVVITERYETSDGTRFDDQEAAMYHERILRMIELLEKLAPPHSYTKEELARELVDLRDELYQVLA